MVEKGWGIKKKLRGSKKIIPRGSKKKYYEHQKKLFTWIETLSCGRGAKIASLTGSKKIIRPGRISAQKRHEKLHTVLARAHSVVKMYETHYARTTVGSSGGRSASPPDALLTTMMVVFVSNLLLLLLLLSLSLSLSLLLLLLFMVVVDIVDGAGAGAGAGGFGAVRNRKAGTAPPPQMHR